MHYKTSERIDFWTTFLLTAIITMVVLDVRDELAEKNTCEISEGMTR